MDNEFEDKLKKAIDNYCNNEDNLIVAVDYDVMLFSIHNKLVWEEVIPKDASWDGLEFHIKEVFKKSKMPFKINKLYNFKDEKSNILILQNFEEREL